MEAILADIPRLEAQNEAAIEAILDVIDELTPLGDGTDAVSFEEVFGA